MKVLAECRHVEVTWTGSYDEPPDYNERPDEGTEYQLVLCPACKSVSLRSSAFVDIYEWEYSFRFIYPALPEAIKGLPDSVKKEYESALRVRRIDTNAFAVMLGRVLDIVCTDRGATGKNLFERLKNLAEQGAIPGRLADMAQSVRQLRNVGAHADLGAITEEEAPILDDLCRAVLEYVYAAPQLLCAVQQKIDKLKSGAK
jgi:hypothetical protein